MPLIEIKHNHCISFLQHSKYIKNKAKQRRKTIAFLKQKEADKKTRKNNIKKLNKKLSAGQPPLHHPPPLFISNICQTI